ncbi:GntR family transcriptional regulator [Streptomyces sp. NPDC057554]|uniref:GntR family transcriptional regulator n=1 Tax=unclassified Streptomyces TaxID=2593676 RepID=UPI00367BA236
MAEPKFDRPPDLRAARLPARSTAAADGADDLVRHVREGLLTQKYAFGEILPSVDDLQSHYGISESEVRAAILRLRRAELLQLHDEYLDTYIMDPGSGADNNSSEGSLMQQVSRLEVLCQDLLVRVEAIESQLQARGEGPRRRTCGG